MCTIDRALKGNCFVHTYHGKLVFLCTTSDGPRVPRSANMSHGVDHESIATVLKLGQVCLDGFILRTSCDWTLNFGFL